MTRFCLSFRFVILCCVLFFNCTWSAAVDTNTGIFDSSFRSLKATLNDNFFASPVIVLDSDDKLTIDFDELTDEKRYLRASVVHCNADWQPSGLNESEYISGFNEIAIDDAEYSRATLTEYVHYRLTIPDGDFRFNISGNYLLRIYDETEPDKTLIQQRFYVSESNVVVNGTVSPVTDIDYKKHHQQLSFSVDCNRSPVENIYNDLKIYVSQNNRTDNQVRLSTPMRVSGKTAIYEHLRELIFPAGNEYRRFETVSTYYPGIHVDNIEFAAPYYHFTLSMDEPRYNTQYLYDQTQHGRFLIREQNSADSDTEADYVVVHFSLDAPYYNGMDVYLDGDFTSRRLDSSSRMIYNPELSRYEKTMLLKQGAYNYQYLTSGKQSPASATATIDGDFSPTVNEYQIKIYTRRHGDRYDRLIGYSTIYSNN